MFNGKITSVCNTKISIKKLTMFIFLLKLNAKQPVLCIYTNIFPIQLTYHNTTEDALAFHHWVQHQEILVISIPRTLKLDVSSPHTI